MDEEVEQKGVDGGWVSGGEWVVVLSLITSQDGQERETPERMLLRRARRRPVRWIEANISAMSYHQTLYPATYLRSLLFLSPSLSLSFSLSLSLFAYQSVCSLFHPRHTVYIYPCSPYVRLSPLPFYLLPSDGSSLPGGRALS